MKLAVFSDIHSNHIAFEACIDDMEKRKPDAIIILGDTISDCPNPQKTITLINELSRQYPIYEINGNRENYFIKHEEGHPDFSDWSFSSNKGSLLYTYEHLTKKDMERLSLRKTADTVELDNKEFVCIVHGSPESDRELLYPGKPNTDSYLKKCSSQFMLCGHSHRQFTYTHGGTTLLNPGSVGIAIGVKKKAHYAMILWDFNKYSWNYELYTVPFNYELLKKEFYKSDLMEKAKYWPVCILYSMETGINYAPLCAKEAYDLAVRDNQKVKWLGIEEKYWKQAVENLGVVIDGYHDKSL